MVKDKIQKWTEKPIDVFIRKGKTSKGKTVKKNVYYKAGFGSFIVHKNVNIPVQFSRNESNDIITARTITNDNYRCYKGKSPNDSKINHPALPKRNYWK